MSKFLLLFNLIFMPIRGHSQTSDRFLLKIVDKTISLKDIHFSLRNLEALSCAYKSSIVLYYFGKPFIKEWSQFLKRMPSEGKEISSYLYKNEEFLKKLRQYFKLIRYSQDQRSEINDELDSLLKESLRANNCSKDVFYKDRLKMSFSNLIKVELYLKLRYGNQLVDKRNANSVKNSIDLFMESLDKQFNHEYYR